MAHSAFRFLAAFLLPGALVFAVLCTLRTPLGINAHSFFWNGPHDQNQPRQLKNPELYSERISRSASKSRLSQWADLNLIGLRSAEDPGMCLKDTACRGYLKGQAKDSYAQCIKRVRTYGNSRKTKDNGCHFMDGRGRGVTALASYPGSGNTWVRSLLEKATGICTGSYSCDMSLRFAGFTGEGIQSSNVIVVKTHDLEPNWGEEKSNFKFSSAIVLVRNPLDAFVSDWNRYVANGFQFKTVHLGTHTQKAGRENFSE